MALTPIGGLGGNFSGPSGWNMKFASWTASYDVELADAQGFSDAGFQFPIPINSGLNGVCAGTLIFDATSTSPLPGALADGAGLALNDFSSCVGSFTLTVTTGCTFSFTGVMYGLQINRPLKGSAVVGAFSFASQGPLTITWDETA